MSVHRGVNQTVKLVNNLIAIDSRIEFLQARLRNRALHAGDDQGMNWIAELRNLTRQRAILVGEPIPSPKGHLLGGG